MAGRDFSIGLLSGYVIAGSSICAAESLGWAHLGYKAYVILMTLGIIIYAFDALCARSSAGLEQPPFKRQVAGSNPAERPTPPQEQR